ncbi:Manganese efflux pump MntP [Brevinematales bacterium NS]|nr:manganese efflux pump [Brevinematales bacterium]QJR22739.1 Manganese efflux pump MntP [Brevinematales bacterium NS]
MEWWTLLGIAVGLSLDALTVSLTNGFMMQTMRWRYAFRIAFAFGFFQALMPLVGWLAGSQLALILRKWEHWIAFGLLAYVGGKMIWESFSADDCERKSCVEVPVLLMMSIATSLDALAVGVTIGVLGQAIILPAFVIGLVTFVICFFGVYVGQRLQSMSVALQEKRFEWVGGVVLIGIGLKILVEHLLKGI